MLAYVAESAASAPPPRGLPFAATPAARASTGAFVPQVFTGGAVSDVDEDALPAISSAAASSDAGGPEDGPSLDELEAQMGGEITARDGHSATPSAAARSGSTVDEEDEPASGGKSVALPDLDSLVARLPAEVRETLDELFRARFVSVKKLPKKVFQAASAKARADRS